MNKPVFNKPAFNVVVPFGGITVIQMNSEMASLISQFILECDDIEPEMRTFAYALNRPTGRSGPVSTVVVEKGDENDRVIAEIMGKEDHEYQDSTFTISCLNNVYSIQATRNMVEMITTFISEVDGEIEKEIVALSHALNNPEMCYELRLDKKNERREQYKSRSRGGYRNDDGYKHKRNHDRNYANFNSD